MSDAEAIAPEVGLFRVVERKDHFFKPLDARLPTTAFLKPTSGDVREAAQRGFPAARLSATRVPATPAEVRVLRDLPPDPTGSPAFTFTIADLRDVAPPLALQRQLAAYPDPLCPEHHPLIPEEKYSLPGAAEHVLVAGLDEPKDRKVRAEWSNWLVSLIQKVTLCPESVRTPQP